MGTIKFAIHMLKADFKKSLFYCGSLIFSTIVVFVFFNMTANPAYGGDPNGRSQSFTTVLSLIVVIIAMVMAFFANSFYLSGKSKELAIETLSGGSVLTLAGYILTQNFMIMLIAMPLGILIGYFVTPLINAYLYPQLGVTDSIWKVYSGGAAYTIVGLLTEMVWLVLLNTGYAYRTEIKTLISAEKTMTVKSKGMIKLPKFVFVLLYILPIALFVCLSPDAFIYLAASCVGLFGISGILKSVIPSVLKKLSRERFLNHPHRLISIGNLNYSLKQSTTLIQMIIISATFLVCFMCTYFNDPKQLIIIIMSYVVLTFMMAVSLVYKVIIEATHRAISFRHLKMIGYITKDLKKIIRQEILGMFSVVILFPMLYFVVILIRFSSAGLMEWGFAISVMAFYIFIFVIAAVISYWVYKGIVLKGSGR